MPRSRAVVAVLTTVLPLGVGIGPAVSTPAAARTASATALPAGTESSRLGLWNWDLETGSSTGAPASWSAVPARATSTVSVRRIDAAAPFARLGTANTVNHVAWLWDSSRTASAQLRSQAFDAAPGRRYVAGATAALGRGKAATINLEFVGSTGRRLSLVRQVGAGPVVGSTRRISVNGVAPAGTVSARILLDSDSARVGSSYWDNFAVEEQQAVPAYDARLGLGSAMFAPGFRVASTSGTTQEVVPGVRHGATVGSPDAVPVYDGYRRGTAPHGAQLAGSVVRDGGLYKMWFTAKQGTNPWSTWYAESTDGVAWTTGREVLRGVSAGSVLRNPDQANPARRYLMLGVRGTMQMTPDKPVMPAFDVDYRTYASPDGQHWTPLSAGPALPSRDIAVVTWDPVAARFVAMTKQPSGRGRELFRSTSRDFVRWTTPHQALRSDDADPAATDVYSTAVFRSGEELVALPSLYTAATVNGVDGPLRLGYASSRDGVHFSRLSVRTPSLPLGRPGSLDDGMVLPASEPVTVGDKVRLYYSGWNGGHEEAGRSSRIFFAEWDRERFTDLRVTGTTGTVTTRALRASGNDLTLNATVPTGGRVTVTVLDASTGTVVPGFEASTSTEVTGDQQAAGVRWGARTFRSLAGRDVVLRFTATQGTRLYSFRVS